MRAGGAGQSDTVAFMAKWQRNGTESKPKKVAIEISPDQISFRNPKDVQLIEKYHYFQLKRFAAGRTLL